MTSLSMLSALAKLPACISVSISLGEGRANAKHVVKAINQVSNSLEISLECIVVEPFDEWVNRI